MYHSASRHRDASSEPLVAVVFSHLRGPWNLSCPAFSGMPSSAGFHHGGSHVKTFCVYWPPNATCHRLIFIPRARQKYLPASLPLSARRVTPKIHFEGCSVRPPCRGHTSVYHTSPPLRNAHSNKNRINIFGVPAFKTNSTKEKKSEGSQGALLHICSHRNRYTGCGEKQENEFLLP